MAVDTGSRQGFLAKIPAFFKHQLQWTRALLVVLGVSSVELVTWAQSGKTPRTKLSRVESILVINAKGSPVVTQEYPLLTLTPLTHMDIIDNAPKNKNASRQNWGGITFSHFLRAAGLSVPDRKIPISLISFDQYVSAPDPSILFKHDVLLGLTMDGQVVPWSYGGPQVVFPHDDPQLPALYQLNAWWTWYMQTILIGTPPPQVELRVGNARQVVPFDPNCPNKSTLPISYPRGMRHQSPPKVHSIETSWCSVSQLLSSYLKNPNAHLRAEFYAGKPVDFFAQESGYQVLWAWKGDPISTPNGGPAQLCLKRAYMNCVYYLKSLQVLDPNDAYSFQETKNAQ